MYMNCLSTCYSFVLLHLIFTRGNLSPWSLLVFNQCCNLTGDLQRLHHKKNLALVSLQKITNIIQKMTKKTLDSLLLYLISQNSRETRSLNVIFVELCKHCFVMQPLPNPTLCSSTSIVLYLFRGSKQLPIVEIKINQRVLWEIIKLAGILNNLKTTGMLILHPYLIVQYMLERNPCCIITT